ncbi:MAG: hypothetical protein NC043_07420 [Muribaculaceae bacterium]|nr:hypothetical protein [Muribaculaceae bacterium]
MNARHIIYTLYTLFLAAVLMVAAVSCSSAVDAENELRSAEMALARGDMEVATSVAEHLSAGENLSGLSASQLARLSVVYMQLADDSEGGTEVVSATDCYRRAYEANADSAAAYYSSLPSEKAQYAMMLSTIVGNQDHPYNPDEHMHEDSIIDGLITDSIAM